MTRRTERINNLIREELSLLLKSEIRDPRISDLTTVTKVVTSSDLKYSKVFISVLGDDDETSETMEGFNSASKYLRHKLSRRLSLRNIPELRFQRDYSIERGIHILNLIEQVSSSEGKVLENS